MPNPLFEQVYATGDDDADGDDTDRDLAEVLSREGNLLLVDTRRSGVTQGVSPDEERPAGFRGPSYFDLAGGLATMLIPGGRIGKAAATARGAAVPARTIMAGDEFAPLLGMRPAYQAPMPSYTELMKSAQAGAARVPSTALALRGPTGLATQGSARRASAQGSARRASAQAKAAAAAAGSRGSRRHTAGMPGRAEVRGAYPPVNVGPLTRAQQTLGRLTGQPNMPITRGGMAARLGAALGITSTGGAVTAAGLNRLRDQVKTEGTPEAAAMAADILTPPSGNPTPTQERLSEVSAELAGLSGTNSYRQGQYYPGAVGSEIAGQAPGTEPFSLDEATGMRHTEDGMPLHIQAGFDADEVRAKERHNARRDTVEAIIANMRAEGRFSETEIQTAHARKMAEIDDDELAELDAINDQRQQVLISWTQSVALPLSVEHQKGQAAATEAWQANFTPPTPQEQLAEDTEWLTAQNEYSDAFSTAQQNQTAQQMDALQATPEWGQAVQAQADAITSWEAEAPEVAWLARQVLRTMESDGMEAADVLLNEMGRDPQKYLPNMQDDFGEPLTYDLAGMLGWMGQLREWWNVTQAELTGS